jgi:hypothetical protein
MDRPELIPLGDRFVERGVIHALGRYCEWLNQYQDKPGDTQYAPEQFLKGFSWYSNTRLLMTTSGNQHLENHELMIWVLEVTDGDEGGPAVLTLFWELDRTCTLRPGHADLPGNYYWVNNGYRLTTALLDFDTVRTMWLNATTNDISYNHKGLLRK